MERVAALGILLVLTGILLLVVSAASSGNIEAGGVIFVGPIPIPLGSRRLWLPMLVIGGVIMLLLYGLRFYRS